MRSSGKAPTFGTERTKSIGLRQRGQSGAGGRWSSCIGHLCRGPGIATLIQVKAAAEAVSQIRADRCGLCVTNTAAGKSRGKLSGEKEQRFDPARGGADRKNVAIGHAVLRCHPLRQR